MNEELDRPRKEGEKKIPSKGKKVRILLECNEIFVDNNLYGRPQPRRNERVFSDI
jgi:hypothetical protein